MSNFFIILAAGKSERFNSSIPKPYVIYKGKPIVQHSIDKAKKCKKIEKILLVVNKKHKNFIKTVNTKNYENNYWEFTRRKVIWARKGDNIKNEIDFDNKILEKIKKEEKNKMIKKEYFENKYKVNIFDKINKFEKYDSLELKKNKRVHNF